VNGKPLLHKGCLKASKPSAARRQIVNRGSLIYCTVSNKTINLGIYYHH